MSVIIMERRKIMSLEKAKQFFEKLKNDAEAIEFVNAQERPETEEGFFEMYAKAASAFGCEASAEEIKSVYEDICKAAADRTKAAEDAVQELSEEALDAVAGGGFWFFNDKEHDECWDTYKHRENCKVVDACDKMIKGYDGYWCAMASRLYCDGISDKAP